MQSARSSLFLGTPPEWLAHAGPRLVGPVAVLLGWRSLSGLRRQTPQARMAKAGRAWLFRCRRTPPWLAHTPSGSPLQDAGLPRHGSASASCREKKRMLPAVAPAASPNRGLCDAAGFPEIRRVCSRGDGSRWVAGDRLSGWTRPAPSAVSSRTARCHSIRAERGAVRCGEGNGRSRHLGRPGRRQDSGPAMTSSPAAQSRRHRPAANDQRTRELRSSQGRSCVCAARAARTPWPPRHSGPPKEYAKLPAASISASSSPSAGAAFTSALRPAMILPPTG
jgi:hypothetical protein